MKSKAKQEIYVNAGKSFSPNEDNIKLINHKPSRRLIRKYTSQRTQRTAHGFHNRKISLADKLQAIWDLKAEANRQSSNSHEARRMFLVELRDRRGRTIDLSTKQQHVYNSQDDF